MLLFTVEWQFRPTGKVLTDGKVSTDAKCRYTMHSAGREENKEQSRCFTFSCLAIKYEFYSIFYFIKEETEV